MTLPTRPQPVPLLVVRACSAILIAAAAWVGAPLLAVAAFFLIPTCTYNRPSPPVLIAVALLALALAAVGPLLVAGRRLLWVGVPAGLAGCYGVWIVAGPLLTESQSGFCF